MPSRSNPGWSTRLASRFSRDLPSIFERELTQVEQESKRIIYLGHPRHLTRRTGRLKASITTAVSVHDSRISASVGTSLPYARTHEFGAVIPRKPQGGVSIIPARPFLLPAFTAKKDEVKSGIIRNVKALIHEECR